MGLINIIDNSKIELKTIITDSKLNGKQKELWYKFIHEILEQEAISILKTIREDGTTLDFLTENLEEKLEAMKTGDKSNWKDIVKKEKDYIESK